MTVRDHDNGARELAARLHDLGRGVKLTVGVHADAAAAKHPSGPTVGEVAFFVELGTEDTAPSGFLRNTIDQQRATLARELADAGRDVIEGATIGEAFGPVVRDLAADVRSQVPVDTGSVRDSVEGRVNGVRVG